MIGAIFELAGEIGRHRISNDIQVWDADRLASNRAYINYLDTIV